MKDFFDKEFCNGSIPKERFLYIEREIGFELPQSYKDLIKDCDEGYPNKNVFKYYDNNLGCITTEGLGAFTSLKKEENSFLSDFKNPPEFFPKGLVTFAENGGGDFICFDYRHGHPNPDPPIVFWRHDADIGKDVSFIAPDFKAFIDMLYQEEE